MYDILFCATAVKLRTIGADPKHLGAEIGFIAILHTWGPKWVVYAKPGELRNRIKVLHTISLPKQVNDFRAGGTSIQLPCATFAAMPMDSPSVGCW